METVLELNLIWIVLLLGLVPFAVALLFQWVTQHSPVAEKLQEYRGVTGPFFASVGLLFGLFAAFLGEDIWQREQAGNHSLEQEIAAIQSIQQIANALGEAGTTIKTNAKHYVELTLAQEWANKDMPRSAIVDTALERLVHAILDPTLSPVAHGAVQRAMLVSYQQIREARVTRRHIADSHSDPYKWVTVILLGCLTQLALVAAHIHNRKAQAAALLIFTLAFVVTLIALAIHERPLANPTLVSLDHMQRLAQ